MKNIIFNILTFIKKCVDKAYYSMYTLDTETLIRKMFPWVETITQQDYSVINNFLLTTSPADLQRIVNVITTFYWIEVNREIWKHNIQWITKYEWLIELCNSLTDFQRIYLAEKSAEQFNT